MNESIFLRLFAAIFISGLFAGASAAEEANQDRRPLRVMTFNIRYDNPEDGLDRWALRRVKVSQIVQSQKTDIVGMQEVLKGQLDDLTKYLPDYSYYGVGRDDGIDKGEFAPIFFRKDLFKLEDKSVFWLSEHPEKIGSKSWDAAITRIATWVKLKDRRNNKSLFVFNTHYDHRGKEARVNSSKLLVKKIPQIAGNHPTVLMGDFNLRNSSEAFKTLTSGIGPERLYDARKITQTPPRGPDSTFNGFRKLVPGHTIDHILLGSGIKAVSFEVLDQKTDEGRFASDHLPVLSVLQLP